MQLMFQATRLCVCAKESCQPIFTPSTPKIRWWKGAASRYLLCPHEIHMYFTVHSKTTSNAIHSRHYLTIWKHPVLKKKALWLAWKLLSWFSVARWVVQDELCQVSTAFQKASKFRTAWIVFKLSSITEIFVKHKSRGNEPGWVSSK